MKDSAKRARLAIVQNGLEYLLSCGESTSRRLIFTTDRIPLNDKEKESFVKEINAKQWQQGVIERLVKANVIERDPDASDVRYRIVDEFHLTKIISDHKQGGLMLAHYVFPNEVPFSGVLDDLKERSDKKDQEITKAQIEHVKAETTEPQVEMGLQEVLTQLLETTVAIKAGQKNAAISFAETINKLNTTIHDQTSALKSLTSAIEVLSKQHETTDNKINSTNKRFDNLELVIKDQKNVLDAGQNTMKKIVSAVETFSTSAGQVSEAALVLQNLKDEVARLTATVKTKEASKLGEIYEKVSRLTSELSTVNDMLLTAATTENK